MEQDIVGYIASTLYVISLFPEIYVVYKTNQCNLTIYFLLFQMLTTGMFIAYDLLINLTPLLVADSILLVELVYLLIYKCITIKKQKNKKYIKKGVIRVISV
jgi:uncharacterized protein with PQ loop repeat